MAPTSRPRVGWGGEQQARVGLDLAGQHELLLIAAGQGARVRVLVAAADVVLLDEPPGRAAPSPSG
jgi:ABC-type uncharacterized transport system YnjBCD ATPase subunit